MSRLGAALWSDRPGIGTLPPLTGTGFPGIVDREGGGSVPTQGGGAGHGPVPGGRVLVGVQA